MWDQLKIETNQLILPSIVDQVERPEILILLYLFYALGTEQYLSGYVARQGVLQKMNCVHFAK